MGQIKLEMALEGLLSSKSTYFLPKRDVLPQTLKDTEFYLNSLLLWSLGMRKVWKMQDSDLSRIDSVSGEF